MTYALATPQTGPDAWLGCDMARTTDWIRPIPARAIDEIDAALRELQKKGLAWPKFGRDDFPLPTYSRDLAAINEELENGRGFVLVRGIPVERYTESELNGDVRDETRRYGEVREPSMDPTLGRSSRNKARSAGPLRFHTDRCDVVSLLTIRKAKQIG